MKSVFMTFVFTALASILGTGTAAETPPDAKPVIEAAGAAKTDKEKDDAAKRPMRMKSRKPMKMDEPMPTPMAKEGTMKEEVKNGMMKKDAEMKKMMQGEEEEMK